VLGKRLEMMVKIGLARQDAVVGMDDCMLV
jgi:hypothetical protein